MTQLLELYDHLRSPKERQKLEEDVKKVYRFATGKELFGNIVRREYEAACNKLTKEEEIDAF